MMSLLVLDGSISWNKSIQTFLCWTSKSDFRMMTKSDKMERNVAYDFGHI